MAQSVTLQLPEAVYERVRQTAEVIKRPVEEVLVRTI
jgi:predicted transcriptional regulator